MAASAMNGKGFNGLTSSICKFTVKPSDLRNPQTADKRRSFRGIRPSFLIYPSLASLPSLVP
jgi:hypothetical protein